ncbi:MAG TPA: hypothetical protein VEC35_09045 [Noviherbaspirillum sp.]|nr:hypothetical protein [Noviherbaspirillum sp.]
MVKEDDGWRLPDKLLNAAALPENGVTHIENSLWQPNEIMARHNS